MRTLRPIHTLAALLVLGTALASPGTAQQLTKTLVVDHLPGATFVTSPPGDTRRLFVLQLDGPIRVLRDGQLLPTPFLDLGLGGLKKITSGGERGLLGLAFHPDYASNGFFYVDYTDLSGNTIVERYSVSAGDPDVADPASGTVVIGPIQQPQSNHNGGCLQFGPDGMLYIGMGDGGNANDAGAGHVTGGNAQSLGTLLGKLLRLDVDLPYPHIPPSNPFVNDPAAMGEIWAYGLRNPWRFSFDRASGELWIGDVGQDAREEIDHARPGSAGLNYGWRCMEGFKCTSLSGCTCNAPELTLPVYDYLHGGCAAVVGGYVYRGCTLTGMQGTYFFADYCKRKIWSFELVAGTVTNLIDRSAELVSGPGFVDSISSFGEDAAGELYFCDATGGRVYRIDNAVMADCNLNGVPDGCDIAAGTSLDVNGDGIPDECACSPGPHTYCVGKINSLGCVPSIQVHGTPKVGNPFPFLIEGHDVLNNVLGILIYGNAPASTPFQGGTLCITGPVRARQPLASGGNPGSKTDCSGVLTIDFNAFVASGADPSLVAGTQVDAQFWSRDTNDFSGYASSLSNAVEFVLCN